MTRLVSSLLELARIEAGVLTPVHADVDLFELAQAVRCRDCTIGRLAVAPTVYLIDGLQAVGHGMSLQQCRS